MGYTPKTIYRRVDLTGTVLEGEDLHVRLKQLNGAALKHFSRISAQLADLDEAAAIDAAAEALSGVIHDWDVEDDDKNPVPPTAANVASYDYPEFVLPLFEAVGRTLNGVGPDLGKGSPNGVPSEVVSVPTEVL